MVETWPAWFVFSPLAVLLGIYNIIAPLLRIGTPVMSNKPTGSDSSSCEWEIVSVNGDEDDFTVNSFSLEPATDSKSPDLTNSTDMDNSNRLNDVDTHGQAAVSSHQPVQSGFPESGNDSAATADAVAANRVAADTLLDAQADQHVSDTPFEVIASAQGPVPPSAMTALVDPVNQAADEAQPLPDGSCGSSPLNRSARVSFNDFDFGGQSRIGQQQVSDPKRQSPLESSSGHLTPVQTSVNSVPFVESVELSTAIVSLGSPEMAAEPMPESSLSQLPKAGTTESGADTSAPVGLPLANPEPSILYGKPTPQPAPQETSETPIDLDAPTATRPSTSFLTDSGKLIPLEPVVPKITTKKGAAKLSKDLARKTRLPPEGEPVGQTADTPRKPPIVIYVRQQGEAAATDQQKQSPSAEKSGLSTAKITTEQATSDNDNDGYPQRPGRLARPKLRPPMLISQPQPETKSTDAVVGHVELPPVDTCQQTQTGSHATGSRVLQAKASRKGPRGFPPMPQPSQLPTIKPRNKGKPRPLRPKPDVVSANVTNVTDSPKCPNSSPRPFLPLAVGNAPQPRPGHPGVDDKLDDVTTNGPGRKANPAAARGKSGKVAPYPAVATAAAAVTAATAATCDPPVAGSTTKSSRSLPKSDDDSGSGGSVPSRRSHRVSPCEPRSRAGSQEAPASRFARLKTLPSLMRESMGKMASVANNAKSRILNKSDPESPKKAESAAVIKVKSALNSAASYGSSLIDAMSTRMSQVSKVASDRSWLAAAANGVSSKNPATDLPEPRGVEKPKRLFGDMFRLPSATKVGPDSAKPAEKPGARSTALALPSVNTVAVFTPKAQPSKKVPTDLFAVDAAKALPTLGKTGAPDAMTSPSAAITVYPPKVEPAQPEQRDMASNTGRSFGTDQAEPKQTREDSAVPNTDKTQLPAVDARGSKSGRPRGRPSSGALESCKKPSHCGQKRSQKVAPTPDADSSESVFPSQVKNQMTPLEQLEKVNRLGRGGLMSEYYRIRHEKDAGTFITAKQVENSGKNRYSDVLCYDHSRVVLNDANNDYINANHVDGFQHRHGYICCQGPLTKTMRDFWKMIWQEQTRVIVMTTRLTEKNRTKCAPYWPQVVNEVCTHGDFDIMNTELIVDPSGDFQTSTLCLCHKGTGETRIVKHKLFLKWPDYGTPNTPQGFLNFVKNVRVEQAAVVRDMPEWKGHARGPPIVVHCSAGIGRTGTFICSDISMYMLDTVGKLNIEETVRLIRTQRAHAVQMPDQYLFCHVAILQYAQERGLLPDSAVIPSLLETDSD